jgi:hypothetical protein
MQSVRTLLSEFAENLIVTKILSEIFEHKISWEFLLPFFCCFTGETETRKANGASLHICTQKAQLMLKERTKYSKKKKKYV